jgi:hypothetical protein
MFLMGYAESKFVRKCSVHTLNLSVRNELKVIEKMEVYESKVIEKVKAGISVLKTV